MGIRSHIGNELMPKLVDSEHDRKSHTEIGHGARDPIVAPVPVLARRANDQLVHRALEPRSARTLTSRRAREFTGDELAVPGLAAVLSIVVIAVVAAFVFELVLLPLVIGLILFTAKDAAAGRSIAVCPVAPRANSRA
jgi:hypothetical protein